MPANTVVTQICATLKSLKEKKMANNLPDEEQRKEALNKNASFVVVAPAGSGKTELLIKRFLTLLKDVGSIEQIVALTFTRKAAYEMRERIFKAIESAFKGESGENEESKNLISLAKEAIKNPKLKKEELLSPNSYLVTTFHSFCEYVLKKYPQSELIPDFKIEDENEANLTTSLVAEELFDKAKREGGDLMESLARRVFSLELKFDVFKSQIAVLLNNRDRILNVETVDKEKEEEIFDWILFNFGKNVYDFLKKREEEFIRTVHYLKEHNCFQGIEENIPEIKKEKLNQWGIISNVFLTKDGKVRKDFSGRTKGAFPKDFPQEFKEFISSLPEECAEELNILRNLSQKCNYEVDEDAIFDISKILKASCEILELHYGKEKTDFTGLQLKTLNALEWQDKTPSRVLQSLNAQIQHILIDEAQDLSDSEYRILEKLTEGWSDNDGRTIFFVGDPKQSIYRFRKANVALFNQLIEKGFNREEEEKLSLKQLTLETNFRSEPHIIDFVNKTFSKIFQGYDFLDDVKYDYFKHKEEAEKDFSLKYNENVSSINDIYLFCNKEKYLDAFVECLKKVLKDKKDGESVGILFSTRTSFNPYREALIKNLIDVEMVEGNKLNEEPAIEHIFNLLKAILFKDVDLYTSGILFSPLFDFDIAKVNEIKKEKGKNWFEKLTNSNLIDENKRNVLKEMADDFYLEKEGQNFIKHFKELDGFYLFSKYYGIKGIMAVKVFLDYLKEIAHLSPTELIEKMESYLEENYAPADPLLSKSKVQAMTIHKAKGLEFDYVFFVGIEKRINKGENNEPPPFILERYKFNEDLNRFDFILIPYEKEEFSYEVLNMLSQKREETERNRLYYVATTRAKKGLFLFGAKLTTKSAGFLGKLKEIYSLNEKEIPPFENVDFKLTAANVEAVDKHFDYEKRPFKIESASEEVDFSKETFLSFKTAAENLENAKARGILIHKIIELLSKGETEIPLSFVKKSLKELRVKEENLAEEILSESLKSFEKVKEIAQGGEIISEIPFEMVENEKLLVGRMDLIIKKEDEIILIDYKTSKKRGSEEDFIKKMVGEYQGQIEVYKNIARSYFKTENIRAYILLTAISHLIEL
jgi:ATP-dependent helicase/nuclease subunit A